MVYKRLPIVNLPPPLTKSRHTQSACRGWQGSLVLMDENWAVRRPRFGDEKKEDTENLEGSPPEIPVTGLSFTAVEAVEPALIVPNQLAASAVRTLPFPRELHGIYPLKLVIDSEFLLYYMI